MTPQPSPGGEGPLGREDVRRIVEDCVAAHVAPLSDYVDAMGMALARLVDQSRRAEPAAPPADAEPPPTVACGAASLTPALLAMTEGIRAVHDSVLALDERLARSGQQTGGPDSRPSERQPEEGTF